MGHKEYNGKSTRWIGMNRILRDSHEIEIFFTFFQSLCALDGSKRRLDPYENFSIAKCMKMADNM